MGGRGNGRTKANPCPEVKKAQKKKAVPAAPNEAGGDAEGPPKGAGSVSAG